METYCAYCVEEFNIKLDVNIAVSHGICKRHFIEEMRKINIPEDSIELLISKQSNYCEDLKISGNI